jgi:hypothetical protein
MIWIKLAEKRSLLNEIVDDDDDVFLNKLQHRG